MQAPWAALIADVALIGLIGEFVQPGRSIDSRLLPGGIGAAAQTTVSNKVAIEELDKLRALAVAADTFPTKRRPRQAGAPR